MAIKQFPVKFDGYHCGDGGLIYPNSNDMQNVRINHHNAIEGMWGTSLFRALSGTNDETVYQYNYWNVAGTATGNRLIYSKWMGGTGHNIWTTDENNTPVVILSAIGSGMVEQPTFITFLNTLLIFEKGDYPRFLSAEGTIVYSLSVAPQHKYCAAYNDRIFTSDGRYILQWSDVDTIHTWPAANVLNINQDDGDRITGIQAYKGDFYIFKRFGVYKVVGDNFDPLTGNYSLIRLEGIPGATNQQAICTANGNMFWVSKNFIIEYNGSGFKSIDFPFLLDDRKLMTYTDYGYAEPFQLCHNEAQHEILFLFKNTTSPGQTYYAYDYLQEQWAVFNLNSAALSAECFLNYTSPTTAVKQLMMLAAGPGGRYMYRFDDSNPYLVDSYGDPKPTNQIYATDWMHGGNVAGKDIWAGESEWTRKTAPKIHIDTKQDGALSACGYALSCSVFFDYDPVAYCTKVFQCDGSTNQYHAIYPDVQTFRCIKIKFANNVLSDKIQVNRVIVEYDLVDESGRI